jgi:diguanylate cyclase (GGDEF)-like protein/PAS domain S-box-containing protein
MGGAAPFRPALVLRVNGDPDAGLIARTGRGCREQWPQLSFPGARDRPRVAGAEPSRSSYLAQQYTLLIVEDNPADERLVRAYLEHSQADNWTVESVARFDAAVERLERGPGVDVVLLDLGLPDSDGVAGVRRLRTRFPLQTVVVLSGTDDVSVGVAAVQAGAQDYLLKGQVKGEMLGRALASAADRSSITRELKEREEQYRDLFESSLAFISVHDMEGMLLNINPAAAEAVGSTPAALIGTSIRDLVHPGARHLFDAYLERIASQGFDIGLLKLQTRSGAARYWEYRNRLKRPAGREPHVVGHAVDVTERRRLERELREASIRDPLTGCFNRRYLERRANDPELGPGWACLVADVDHFKEINDTRGHSAGDEVLVRLARFFQASTRLGDAVVRMGGDEFLILLNGASQEEAARFVARLRDGAQSAPASFSIGVAVREGREPLFATIKRADKDLVSIRAVERSVLERRRKSG